MQAGEKERELDRDREIVRRERGEQEWGCGGKERE